MLSVQVPGGHAVISLNNQKKRISFPFHQDFLILMLLFPSKEKTLPRQKSKGMDLQRFLISERLCFYWGGVLGSQKASALKPPWLRSYL